MAVVDEAETATMEGGMGSGRKTGMSAHVDRWNAAPHVDGHCCAAVLVAAANERPSRGCDMGEAVSWSGTVMNGWRTVGLVLTAGTLQP